MDSTAHLPPALTAILAAIDLSCQQVTWSVHELIKKKGVLLKFHFILTSFKDLNFPLLKVKFSDFFPNHFLTDSNHA